MKRSIHETSSFHPSCPPPHRLDAGAAAGWRGLCGSGRRAGSPQLRTTRELADGLTYSNTITSHSAAGRVESFSLELSPDSREVEPIFLQASGTAYGAGSINLAVSYAQSLGYHVLGAINTDFFAPSTGVPLGISIEDGIYKSSPEAEAAVVITDGEVELVEQSQVTLTLTNESTGGQTVLTHLNKYRADSGGLYLFNYDFSTVSTHTSTPGWMRRFTVGKPRVEPSFLPWATRSVSTWGWPKNASARSISPWAMRVRI